MKDDKLTIMNFERKGIDPSQIVLPNQKIYYLKQTNEYFLTFQEYSTRNKELILTNYTPLLANMKANLYQCEEYDMQKSSLLLQLPFDHVLTMFSIQEYENMMQPQRSYLIGGLVRDSKNQYGIIVSTSQSHVQIHKIENDGTYSRKYYTVNQSLFDQQNIKQISITSLFSSDYPKYDSSNNLIIGMTYKYFKNENYTKLYHEQQKMQPQEVLQLLLSIKQEFMEKINSLRQAYSEKLNLQNQKQMLDSIYIDNEKYDLVPYDQVINKQILPQDPAVDLINPPSLSRVHKQQRQKKNTEKQSASIKPINDEERKLQAQVIKKLIFSDIKAVMDQYFEQSATQVDTNQEIENIIGDKEQSEQSDGINIDELNERAELLIQQGIDRDKISAFKEQVMLPLDFEDIQQTMQQWADQQEDLDTTQVVTTKHQSANEADILQNSENLREFIKESLNQEKDLVIDDLQLQAIKVYQFISQYSVFLNCQHISCVDFLKAFTYVKNEKIITDNTLFKENELQDISKKHPELKGLFPQYNDKLNIMLYELMIRLTQFLFQNPGVSITDKRNKKRDFIEQLVDQQIVPQKVLDQYLKELGDEGEEEYNPTESEEEIEEDEQESENEQSTSQTQEDQSSSYEPEEEASENIDTDDLSKESFVVSEDDIQPEEEEENEEQDEQEVEDNSQEDEQDNKKTDKILSLAEITTYKQLQTFYYKRDLQIYLQRGATDDIYIDRIVHYIVSKMWQKCDYVSLYRIIPILYRISDNYALKQMLCGIENKDVVQRNQFSNSEVMNTITDQMPIRFLNELFNAKGKYIKPGEESISEQIQRQVEMLKQYEGFQKCSFLDLDYKYQFELLNWLIDQVSQINIFTQYCQNVQDLAFDLSEKRKQLILERQAFNQKEQKVRRQKLFDEETEQIRIQCQKLAQFADRSQQDKNKYKEAQQQLLERNFKLSEQQKIQQMRNEMLQIDEQINQLDLINNNLLLVTDSLQNKYYYIDYDQEHKILMFDVEHQCYRLLSCETIKAMEPYINDQNLMYWNDKELILDDWQKEGLKTPFKSMEQLSQEHILQSRQITAMLKQEDVPIQFKYMIDTTGYGLLFLSQQNQQNKLRQIWDI